MFIKRGFNAEQSTESSKLKGLIYKHLLMKVYADEGEGSGNGDDGGNNSPQINFESLIANARKEEKDKLYPRIKKLEEENKTLVQSNNDSLIKLAEAQKELNELKSKGDSQEVQDLKAQLETAQTELKQFKESAPKEDEIRAKIEAEYEVKLYRQTKLSEGSDKILKVLESEVTGSTKEEIDASFEKAVEKTVEAKKQLGLLDKDGNPVDTKKKPPKKEEGEKKPPKAPPVANPNDEEDDEFDADYVRNLDPRSEEYKEFRKKMGLR